MVVRSTSGRRLDVPWVRELYLDTTAVPTDPNGRQRFGILDLCGRDLRTPRHRASGNLEAVPLEHSGGPKKLDVDLPQE